MSKRIRYKKSVRDGDWVESVKTFTADTGAKYKVFLDLDNKLFYIKNLSSERFVKKGGENIKNMNVLKRTAKQRLEGLGVSFDDEVRSRTFGLCSKGWNQDKEESKF